MKISSLTREQAEAISRLRNDKDFGVFIDYVAGYGEDLIKALMANPKLENPEFHRGSGGAITEILKSIEVAQQVLEQYKSQS